MTMPCGMPPPRPRPASDEDRATVMIKIRRFAKSLSEEAVNATLSGACPRGDAGGSGWPAGDALGLVTPSE